MGKFVIQGGKKLKGKVGIAANKNAVLPIMAASVLAEGESVIHNVPYIRDVEVMADILRSIGCRVEREDRTVFIDAKGITSSEIAKESAIKLRASVLFLGPLLARTGSIQMYHPGGDIIGRRGIETHIDALNSIGCNIVKDDLLYKGTVERGRGGHIFMSEPSVTGTENVLMFSALSGEEVVIDNAASEPHIRELASFLELMGAEVAGAGTNRITVKGKEKLNGAEYNLSPDFVEAGTFAITAAITSGELSISPYVREDLQMIELMLGRFGIDFEYKGEELIVRGDKLSAPDKTVQTAPWPGFPTDLMSPLIVLATQSEGQTLCHDPMYESRMFFVDNLIRMGAEITICDPHRVIVYGGVPLSGRHLTSPDIRAGAALVLAALAAEGESVIDNTEIIERGYENLAERLSQIGADIQRVE